MSQVTFIAPVDEMTGKYGEKTILRKKKFRAPNGKVLFEGPTESYPITNPRNYKKNPPKGAEKQRLDNWANACQRAKEELKDETLAAAWRKRFEAQLKQPEANAPLDPNTHKPKVYTRFDCYVRAAIFRELSAQI